MPVNVTKQLMEAVCEGPNCAELHNGVVKIEWDNVKAADAPDSLYRLVTIIDAVGGKFAFCSAGCAIDWLENVYKPHRFREDNPNYKDKNDFGDVVPLKYVAADATEKLFASAASAIDWLKREYVAPMSPREKAAQEANNAEVDKKKVVSISEAK